MQWPPEMGRESSRYSSRASSSNEARTDRKRRSEEELISRETDGKRTRLSHREDRTHKQTIDPKTIDPDDPAEIAKFLGFSNFKTTKGKKVPGNNVGCADVKKKREYRQMLHVKKLYEIPLTRQQLEEKESLKAAAAAAESSNAMQI